MNAKITTLQLTYEGSNVPVSYLSGNIKNVYFRV